MARLIKLGILAYWRKAKACGLDKVCQYWFLARAFEFGDDIYIMSIFANQTWLVAHELGHVHGMEHVPIYQFSIMNPTGFLRWYLIPSDIPLVEEARKLIND